MLPILRVVMTHCLHSSSRGHIFLLSSSYFGHILAFGVPGCSLHVLAFCPPYRSGCQLIKKKKMTSLGSGSVSEKSLPQANREIWEGKNNEIWLRKKKGNKLILVPWKVNLTNT